MKTNKFEMVFGGNSEGKERKKGLRAYMKKRRADNANRDVKEVLLVENFFALLSSIFPKMQGAGTGLTVFVYQSFSSEAPTDLLVERLLAQGVKVCAPRVENQEMVAVEYTEDFTLSTLGIREPVGQAFAGKIDLVVTPLLAVDEQGNRLGYGGGYYDRFFEKNMQALKVGYAFDFQIVESVPVEENDVPLDYTVTDKRVIAHKS